MRKIIPILLLLLISIPCLAQQQEARMIQGVTGSRIIGVATPDWSTSLEGTAACSTVFTNNYNTTDCDDTAHPSDGVQDLKCSSGATSGVRLLLTASKTEVWVSFSIYLDSATPGVGYYIDLTDNTSADTLYLLAAGTPRKFRLRTLGNTTNYNGSTTVTGQTMWYIRIHFKLDNTTGIAQLWSSTNKTSWTAEVNQSNIDTLVGTATSLGGIIIGKNGGSNLPEDWYFDDIRIYYTDPTGFSSW